MPYSKIEPEKMILRDHLARDRTELANERTLLSYIRTAVAFLAAGGTLLKFFPGDRFLQLLGAFLLLIGTLCLAIGIWRFVTVAGHMRKLRPKEEVAPAPTESEQ